MSDEQVTESAFSGANIFICAPLKLTEDDKNTINEVVDSFLTENEGKLKRAALFHFDIKSMNSVVEPLVKRHGLRDRPVEIDWKLKDKGGKPLFEALKKALRRAHVVMLFDDNEYMNWAKEYISEQAVEGKMKLFVKQIREGHSNGEES